VTLVHRVLYPTPLESLDAYRRARGGSGLDAARSLAPDELIAVIEASGLRGRGGAGFPTGRKWRTVRDYRAAVEPTTVVVNAAEGEPSTFKDRMIIRNDPYAVVEGALIAAHAVEAESIVIATKQRFATEAARLRAAIAEMEAAGWFKDASVEVFEGPEEYLYGEETALLEVLDGRYPLPRIAPPYRRGIDEIVESESDLRTGSGLSAHVEMAEPDNVTGAPPALVDNVETMANVPRIVARGADWFRTDGTDASPGTIVCTITGSTRRHGVGEVLMGTPLREVIDEIGGGPREGRRIRAVLPGASNAFITEDQLDTPLAYETFNAIGSGLGSGSFIVFDDQDDLVAAAAGALRFLAIESCGQCTPCKLDGLRIADLLAAISRSKANEANVDELQRRIATVAEGARCSLGTQQQTIAASLVDRFPDDVDGHFTGTRAPAEPIFVAEVVDISNGRARLDERHRDKQPDWTYDEIDSGQLPAARLGEHRSPESLE
jgi:NADH:ubiquinone oxidoreductase subunit F (NADH-binding)